MGIALMMVSACVYLPAFAASGDNEENNENIVVGDILDEIGNENCRAHDIAATEPESSQRVPNQQTADECQRGGNDRHDDRVFHPAHEVGLLKEIAVVLEGGIEQDEGVLVLIQQILIRFQ